ncbi:YqaA family protein [Phenylobacterium immobile]|uniref:YqaA family protein n=1 Tax=Phenylobacterium immobile TaxID=21 RepID=UPI000A4B26AA|nr:YqaA family protein [Phenylobacterium immobile]
MLRKLYDWVMTLARSPRATPALAAVSFAESSFFPVPPDVMLAPMVLARPDRAYFYAFVCTAASVVGGMLGYAIGVFLEPIGLFILKLFGHPEGREEFQRWFDQFGLWVILAKGLTPIPYKLVTITAGFARFDVFTFIWASILTRGARFFIVASVLKFAGPAMLAEFERRLTLYSLLLLAVFISGFIALKVFL